MSKQLLIAQFWSMGQALRSANELCAKLSETDVVDCRPLGGGAQLMLQISENVKADFLHSILGSIFSPVQWMRLYPKPSDRIVKAYWGLGLEQLQESLIFIEGSTLIEVFDFLSELEASIKFGVLEFRQIYSNSQRTLAVITCQKEDAINFPFVKYESDRLFLTSVLEPAPSIKSLYSTSV